VALEALGVLLRPEEARRTLPILAPDLPHADRLERLGGSDGPPTDLDATLRSLIEDRGSTWQSPWLRACAIHTAIGRRRLDGMDLGNARALQDPVIDELLAAADKGTKELIAMQRAVVGDVALKAPKAATPGKS
jgi:hypothetical protein